MDEFGCDILGDESGEEEDQGQQLEQVAGFEGGDEGVGEGEETDAMVGVDQEDSVEATTTVDDEVTQPALEDVPEPLAPSTPLSSEADAFVDAMQVVDQETIVPTDSVNPTVTETLVGIVADSVNTQEEKSENAPQEAAAEKTDIIDEGKAIVEDRLDVMDLAEPVQPAPSAKATAKPKKSRKKPPTKAASTTTTAPETVEETEDVDLAPAAEPSSEKENKKKRSSPKTSSRKTRISVAPAAASRDAEMNETPILDVADESGKVESIDETSPTKSKDSEIDVKVEESSETSDFGCC
ncbi:hypothetical protein BDR26DRAFT_66842 [Obelidium mucronatum]|nr:hypothetical protein BDR26DRAFT_66842 [Obelidium mucronatum]